MSRRIVRPAGTVLLFCVCRLQGGYPENALHPSMEYLANLIDDILSRDIMRLFPVRKPFLLKNLLRLLAASVGSRTSFNKLARVLGVNLETVKDYVAHLELAFPVAVLEKWTDSWSDRVYAARKIYLLDADAYLAR